MANDWMTPDVVLDAARSFFGKVNALVGKHNQIDLDAASSAQANKRVKARRFFSEQDSALRPDRPWRADSLWLNPPYGRGLITPFVDRFLAERPYFAHGLMLTNVDTSTLWYHRAARVLPLVLFKERLAFVDPATGKPARGNRYQQAIFYSGHEIAWFAAHFERFGLFYLAADSQWRPNK